MSVVLAAISSGGLVGVADQYLCLLIVSLAANFGWVELNPSMDFMTRWWFMGLVGIFWILTVAPAYLATVAPGVMNTVNTAVNFLSGFVVPLSSALIGLAAAGIISNMNPELQQALDTIGIFKPGGGIAGGGWAVAGGGAALATTLTAVKAMAKPAISASTGTLGTYSAPIYATGENLGSVVVMGLVYALSNISPWLLVVLLVIVLALAVVVLIYSIVQLRKLKTGVGQILALMQASPKAGIAVLLEFLIWGSGWLMWGHTKRGLGMLVFWGVFGLVWWGMFALVSLLPFLHVGFLPLSLMVFILIGSSSSKRLMKELEPLIEEQPAAAPAAA